MRSRRAVRNDRHEQESSFVFTFGSPAMFPNILKRRETRSAARPWRGFARSRLFPAWKHAKPADVQLVFWIYAKDIQTRSPLPASPKRLPVLILVIAHG